MTVLLALLALPATAILIRTALRSRLARRVVATPTGDRWHDEETPSFGGVGITLGLLAGVAAALLAGAMEPTRELAGIVGGCVLLCAVGFADDLFSLSPVAKLAAQVGAAVLLLVSGLSVEIVHNDLLAWTIALVWVIGITNAFNLLDNIDGLASSIAAIACVFFAIDAATVHDNDLVLTLALATAAACAGFLPFNFRIRGRARIFMGDSGSQVLGFMLASLSLAASWEVAGTTVATMLLPILILAVPILDTTLVTVVRLLEGRPVYAGGRDHTSHRLVGHGLSEKRAVLLLAAIAAGLGLTSLAYTVLDDPTTTAIGVLISFALLVQFASFLADADREPTETPEGRSFALRTLVVHRRRMIEMLVDFALITAAFGAAYLLRFEGGGPQNQRALYFSALPILLAARYAVFIPFGLYSSVWRYVGARDAVRIVAAVAVSEVFAVGFLALSYLHNFDDYSRSVFVIDALLCTLLIGASRFGERALARSMGLLGSAERRRTLVVGAGRGGRSLLLELRETPGEQVVGFVDDDPRLRGRRLQGVQVVGGLADMERILEETRPDTVLVTIPDAPRERLDFVVDGCAEAAVRCQFVRRDTNVDPRLVLGPPSP